MGKCFCQTESRAAVEHSLKHRWYPLSALVGLHVWHVARGATSPHHSHMFVPFYRLGLLARYENDSRLKSCFRVQFEDVTQVHSYFVCHLADASWQALCARRR